MTDWSWVRVLCERNGVAGRENSVRDCIRAKITPFADCRVDALGNLIAEKRGKARPGHRIMLEAAMDEPGLLVTAIGDDGTLHILPLGGVAEDVLVGASVLVGEKNLPGVVGIKPIHLTKKEESNRLPSLSECTVDIGACSKAEAAEWVKPGDAVHFPPYFDTANELLRSKALPRVLCALLAELICTELPYDMTFVFSAQGTVGGNGAKTAAFSVQPEMALLLRTASAMDYPKTATVKQNCALRRGAVLHMADKGTAYDRMLTEQLMCIAEERQIPLQIAARFAGSPAAAVQTAANGVRTSVLSLPCRYGNSGIGVAAQADYEALRELVLASATRFAGEER